MNAKVDALYQNIENLTVVSSAPTMVVVVSPTNHVGLFCEVCGVNGHSAGDCQLILVVGTNVDTINYVNNQTENPYSNTYNAGWRDHPNFSYENNQTQNAIGPSGFPQGVTPRNSNLETMMKSFVTTQT